MSATATRADLREGGAWSPRQRWKNDAIHLLAKAILAIAMKLPRSWLLRVGRAVGRAASLLLRATRSRARARLARGLGRSPTASEVSAVFLRAGELLGDTVSLLRSDERASSSLALDDANAEVFRAALAEGRGVVYVTAHLGPWERMAALLVERGFPVATVARESYDPRFTELYDRLRGPRGVRSIYRGRPGAARAIVRELARGGAVGFLVDLPGRASSFEAELFGSRWRLARGAVRIALARGAVLVLGTPTGILDGRPALHLERIDPDVGGEGPTTDALVRALDQRVRAAPSAWLGLLAGPGAEPG